MSESKRKVLQNEQLKKSHAHPPVDRGVAVCPNCRGFGWVRGQHFRVKCTVCEGTGEVDV